MMGDYIKIKATQKVNGVKNINIVSKLGFELTVKDWERMLRDLTKVVFNEEVEKELFND